MKKFFTNSSSLVKIVLCVLMFPIGAALSIMYWQIVLPALVLCLILFGIVRAVQRYNRWIVWKATRGTMPFPQSSRLGIRFSLVNIVLSVMLVISIAASIVHITHATAPNPGHNFTEVGGGILQGQLIYGSAADTFSALPPSTVTTTYLSNEGTNNNPAWAQINLTNGVINNLPPGNGGTGVGNGSNNTITFTGNYTLGITLSAATTLTFPTSGTVTALGNSTTGSGSIVLATSPVLSTPTLGVATVTTINGLTPATTTNGFTIAGGTTPATLTITGSATISATPMINPMTTTGDIIYGQSGGAPGRLAATSTTGAVLMNTASAAPSWMLLSQLPSTAGILPVANGGTGTSTLTANGVVLGAGTGVPTFVVTSTAGALLESNGTTWVAAIGGVLINQQTFIASGTYTPTTGATKIIVQMWGGGGAGGSCTAVAGCASGGGGSGGYAEYYSSSPVSGAVTIGSGGAAVAGGTGGAGTATSLVQGGTTITANGGAGGTTAAGTAATKYTAGGAGGVISTSGTVNAGGTPGGFGSTSATATIGATGAGRSTSLGGGGVGVAYSSAAAVAGTAAVANTGSGGSGGGTGVTTVAAGGAGAKGLVIIYEYR